MERRGKRKAAGGKKGKTTANGTNGKGKRKFPTLAGMTFASAPPQKKSRTEEGGSGGGRKKRKNKKDNKKNEKCKGQQKQREQQLANASAKATDSQGGYTGWVPPQRRGGKVAVEDLSSLPPDGAGKRLWDKYVAARQPVVLRSGSHHLLGPQWAAGGWTLDRLRERAGACGVKVERRDSSRGRFGEGREVRTTFGAFLEGLAAGDDLHYMTTQDIARDADGRPEIIAPPLTLLSDDFPMRPALMGHLVPASINLWMGNSREGALSGLHHDYHDNLYILLKGRKRFQLFPPSDAGRMYTQGRIVQVHPNGLIAYQRGVRSDGADAGVEAAVAAEEAHARAEEELAAAEAAAECGEPGADERLRSAEAALESALEAVLAAQMDGDGDDEDEDDAFVGKDDFDDFEYEDVSEKKASKGEEEEEETEMVRKKDVDGSVLPKNFSKVDMTLPPEEREVRWPLLKEASMIECEVRAGDMLFLPAGWFHNVTSFSDNQEGLHMAFNYWFHPPDASAYERPYRSDFWQRDWAARTAATDAGAPSTGE